MVTFYMFLFFVLVWVFFRGVVAIMSFFVTIMNFFKGNYSSFALMKSHGLEKRGREEG